MLEAALLLVLGLFGAAMSLWHTVFLPVTVVLLCFIMGLQNAVITQISRPVIRTTHVTGLLLYVNRHADAPPVRANRGRIRMHAQLIVGFLVGGLAGALGFKYAGYISTLPLAIWLLILVMRPALNDWQRWHAA